jgi:hypothetical protein
MRYQLDIHMTEEDYLQFNLFQSLELPDSKKAIRRAQLTLLGVVAAVLVLYIWVVGWTTFSIVYVPVMCLLTTIYLADYKKRVARNIRSQIKRLRKTGKLPYDENSRIEFYEDRIVETAASSRVEKGYEALERICVLEDRYIFLFTSCVAAYILPVPQVKAQIDMQEFLDFLSGKCNTVEYY